MWTPEDADESAHYYEHIRNAFDFQVRKFSSLACQTRTVFEEEELDPENPGVRLAFIATVLESIDTMTVQMRIHMLAYAICREVTWDLKSQVDRKAG